MVSQNQPALTVAHESPQRVMVTIPHGVNFRTYFQNSESDNLLFIELDPVTGVSLEIDDYDEDVIEHDGPIDRGFGLDAGAKS